MMFRVIKRLRVLLAAGLLFALWFFAPRQADMEQFDPAEMGQLESDMWRHYYEKSYVRLGADLFLASHGQYGFSPWDSVRMAWHAAKAARLTQPSQPRAQAFAVGIPPLVKYYEVIQKATGSPWKPEEMAPLELEWWVMRREKATWPQYGETISQLTAMTYQIPIERVREACLLRAEMMDYRDQRRNGGMKPEDWEHISKELGISWQMLKTAVTTRPP
jgi:hypothetical protein